MPEIKIIVTVPGASERELYERASAAMAVFARLDADPAAAARAAFTRDRWDDRFGPDAPGLSDREFALAEAWQEAVNTAMADREGWTKAPPESNFELVIPDNLPA